MRIEFVILEGDGLAQRLTVQMDVEVISIRLESSPISLCATSLAAVSSGACIGRV